MLADQLHSFVNMWHLRVSSAYVVLDPFLTANPTCIPPRVASVRETDLLGFYREFRNIVQRPPYSEVVRKGSAAMTSFAWIAHLLAKGKEDPFAHSPIDNPWERSQDDQCTHCNLTNKLAARNTQMLGN